MRNNSLRIMEIIWIATGVICVGIAIKSAFTGGGRELYLFGLMALVSFLFGWYRYKQRKKG